MDSNTAQKNQIATNLALQNNGNTTALVNGLVHVPTANILQQIQYLQNIMLPKALAKFGPTDENYLFYKSVADSLVFALQVLDENESLRINYSREKYLNTIMQQHHADLEKELLKYTTLQQAYTNMSFDMLMQITNKNNQQKGPENEH